MNRRTREAAALLTRLARALHAYGMPSHRLEEALEHVRATLGVEAQFLVTPTSVQAAIGPETEQRTVLLRIDAGETNLEKLARLTDVIRALAEGRLDARRAREQVDRIVNAPLRYGKPATVAAYLITAGTAAIFFQGGWHEAAVSAAIGLGLGLLAVASIGRPRAVAAFPVIAAFVATVAAQSVSPYFQPFAPFLSSLAGMIVLFPGLTLTIAVNELASRHLVSGTARLMGALITFMQIGVGVALGWLVAGWLSGGVSALDGEPATLERLWALAALPLSALGFTVIFRARPGDYLPIALAAGTTFFVARWSSDAFGPEIGAAGSAWLLGLISNLFARLRDRPSATTLLPGLLILVPGSVGFRSISALLADDVVAGLETGVNMMLIAVSLVTGLFLANLTLPPRKLL